MKPGWLLRKDEFVTLLHEVQIAWVRSTNSSAFLSCACQWTYKRERQGDPTHICLTQLFPLFFSILFGLFSSVECVRALKIIKTKHFYNDFPGFGVYFYDMLFCCWRSAHLTLSAPSIAFWKCSSKIIGASRVCVGWVCCQLLASTKWDGKRECSGAELGRRTRERTPKY